MIQNFFSSNYLGNIHDESKKGMDYFFAVNFNLVGKKTSTPHYFTKIANLEAKTSKNYII